jgi:putative acetyltransferase
MSLELLRTDSNHQGFQTLVVLLDRELKERDGDDHAFFAQFNKIDHIHHVVVAMEDGNHVGCGAIKAWAEDAMEVKRMYVPLDRRGQGIAGKVLAELEQWAAELGYKACVLETGIKQPEAIRVYEKAGYSRIPNYGQYIGVKTSVCMRKELAP